MKKKREKVCVNVMFFPDLVILFRLYTIMDIVSSVSENHELVYQHFFLEINTEKKVSVRIRISIRRFTLK
ncbi:hypothetical protein DERP_003412 [Dermatophagoides pteronyssinus]|uniref:Uncharacterized protein n=1 Tax=Dermatophagoides pteronyssinus TaxID=6956 RepID=A0ABQ8JJR7_DERPT|nr:hypothetical protein DERP_003412 [Dermatophagoides pteronyssinus]